MNNTNQKPKIMINALTKLLKRDRKRWELFVKMFSDEEQTAIINALFRRSTDLGTIEKKGDEKIRETCKAIAMEMMTKEQ